MGANCIVIEEADKYGVHGYVFAPCIVYGKGEGFGNAISIQTVEIVKAGRALGRVYKVDKGRPVSTRVPLLQSQNHTQRAYLPMHFVCQMKTNRRYA